MIDLNRPVRRRVRTHTGAPLVVTLAPEGLYVRQAGKRTTYLLPYGVAFVQAVERDVARRREMKAATRRR